MHVDVQFHGIDYPLRCFYHSLFVENLAKTGEIDLVRQKDIFVDGYIRNQRLFLEHPRDTEQVCLFVIRRLDLLAAVFDTSTIRSHDPRDDVEQSRFAGAVFADYSDDTVARDGETDVIENHRLAETLAQSINSKNIGRHLDYLAVANCYPSAGRCRASDSKIASNQAFFIGEGSKNFTL